MLSARLASEANIAACRAFNGRPSRITWGMAGALVWLAAWPLTVDKPHVRLALIGLTASIYLALSAWELARHAPQQLLSQRAVVAVYAIASLFCLARGILGPSMQTGFWAELFSRGWTTQWALLVLSTSRPLRFSAVPWRRNGSNTESRQSALTDPLTLLPNRRSFFQKAEALVSRYTSRPLSCLLFDLDRFKQINDVYGHQVGDQVLQGFAHILVTHLPGGVFGRLGGEEFAALIEGTQEEAFGIGRADQERPGTQRDHAWRCACPGHRECRLRHGSWRTDCRVADTSRSSAL